MYSKKVKISHFEATFTNFIYTQEADGLKYAYGAPKNRPPATKQACLPQGLALGAHSAPFTLVRTNKEKGVAVEFYLSEGEE